MRSGNAPKNARSIGKRIWSNSQSPEGREGCRFRHLTHHVCPYRGLRTHRRLRNRGTGQPSRLHRLAVLAALRFAGLFRRSAWHRRQRPLVHRASGDYTLHPALSRSHAGRRNHLRDRRGSRPPARFHAAAQWQPAPGAHRSRHTRQRRPVHGAGLALRLRTHGSLGDTPGRWRAARDCRPRYGRPDHTSGPLARREPEDGKRIHHRPRKSRWLRSHLRAVLSTKFPQPVDAEQALHETIDFWQEWAGRAHVHGEYASRTGTFADHPESADLPAHRRHRGRAHDVAAGMDWQRAQLGLSLLLAARRYLHPAGA